MWSEGEDEIDERLKSLEEELAGMKNRTNHFLENVTLAKPLMS